MGFVVERGNLKGGYFYDIDEATDINNLARFCSAGLRGITLSLNTQGCSLLGLLNVRDTWDGDPMKGEKNQYRKG